MLNENDNFISRPFARAAIRGRKLILQPWGNHLIHGGPMAVHLRSLRAALVDLVRVGENELIVDPVPLSRFDDTYARTVISWAEVVGYSRVWLPGQVVELGSELDCGTASIVCPTCGMRSEDNSHGFWLMVRKCGCFPNSCIACGGSLPQWDVRPHQSIVIAQEDELSDLIGVTPDFDPDASGSTIEGALGEAMPPTGGTA